MLSLKATTDVAEAAPAQRIPVDPSVGRNASAGGFLEGAKGSRGMGVVSNNWSDRALLSILYMFKP